MRPGPMYANKGMGVQSFKGFIRYIWFYASRGMTIVIYELGCSKCIRKARNVSLAQKNHVQNLFKLSSLKCPEGSDRVQTSIMLQSELDKTVPYF